MLLLEPRGWRWHNMLADKFRTIKPTKPPEFVGGNVVFFGNAPTAAAPLVLPLPAGSLAGQLMIGQMYYRRAAMGVWASLDGATLELQYNIPTDNYPYVIFSKILTAADITRGNLRFYVTAATINTDSLASFAVYKSRGIVPGSLVQSHFLGTSHTTFNFTIPGANVRGAAIVLAHGTASYQGGGVLRYGMIEPAGWSRRARHGHTASGYAGQIVIEKLVNPGFLGETDLMGYQDTQAFDYSFSNFLLLKPQP